MNNVAMKNVAMKNVASKNPNQRSNSLPRRSPTRQDIVDFLSTSGPIRDSEGRATSALRRALGFEGKDGAFIQVVSAMARAGEIERIVTGKRTFEIRLPSATAHPASPSLASSPLPASPAPVTAPSEGESSTHEIDYDELAAVLLARMTRLVADSESGGSPTGWTKRRVEGLETRNAVTERELARARAELKAVEAERDDLKSRLDAAEHNLSVLSERYRSSVAQTSAKRAARLLGTEDRALLHRLTGQQHHEGRPSERTG